MQKDGHGKVDNQHLKTPANGPVNFPAHAGMDGLVSAWSTLTHDWSGVTKSAMKLNVDLMALANRRRQAYLALPGQCAACRKPNDLIGLQVSFWNTCMKDYMESAHALTQHMAGLHILTGIEESLSDPVHADLKSTRHDRDYITFPEPVPAGDANAATPQEQRHRPAA
ncbi:MAG TPA: hypothetical protein VMX97_02315 [Hyphomicrobiaceae bacterium]|nr:hypothetical protein [Hyphomicrobiaceae bacterium]